MPEPTNQYDRIMQAVGSVYAERGWPEDVRALEAMSDAVEKLIEAEVAAEQAVSADLRERLRVTSDDCFTATCEAQDAREALARVRAAVSDLAGERLTPGDMRKAVVTAIERPAEQSILRPAHDDGTPYQYSEIVVDGWGHCDGCRTWIRGYTGSNPHRCDANWQAVRKEAPDA